jgi:hypothetical protein
VADHDLTDAQALAFLDDADAGLVPDVGLAPLRAHVEDLIAERDRLRATLGRAQTTVTFFASFINSGERWSPACEAALRAAFDTGQT